jgi:S-(hydroxymethyl)glutathione dehydrogenase/alcohol dehydrogenase
MFPFVGGHEGAGVVVEVGPEVTSLRPGDHVVGNWVPSCGRCRSCANGRQNLCDAGGNAFVKGMVTDGTDRHFLHGEGALLFAKLGTFSQYATVGEISLIKLDPKIPFQAAALVGCGVATGWGSAVKRAQVAPGDFVIVVGIGGLGTAAVQGARIAGAETIVAIDPVPYKHEVALEFGASHAFSSMTEALEPVRNLSSGRMADKVILTPGVMHGELLAEALELTAKGGTVVVTAVTPFSETTASMSLTNLAMWEKELKGTIYGSLNPRADIPRLLSLYQKGQLKLDEMVTRTYSLDEINEGYADMKAGRNIRGVIAHG